MIASDSSQCRSEVSYVNHSNDFSYHHNSVEYDIRMNLMENFHKIKFLCESLNSSVDSIKMIVKHCEMMNNQVEQMISLQNKLYEKLIAEKKHVC